MPSVEAPVRHLVDLLSAGRGSADAQASMLTTEASSPSRATVGGSMDEGRARVRVLISGDVQGVGFRWYCRERAMGAGLAGFVRNLPDGRVEAAFEGPAAAVGALVEWCRRGPDMASVAGVETHPEEPLGDSAFRISRG